MADTHDNTLPHAAHAAPPVAEALGTVARLDILISQIVDAEGGPGAWSEFAKLAGDEPGAWRDLALAQRDYAALALAVAPQLARAERIQLPDPSLELPVHTTYRISRWAGWATAAALALTWLGTQFSALNTSRSADLQNNLAGLLPVGSMQVDSPQDAITAYKQLGQQSGTVLGELPDRVIIESRPLAGGRGFEVVYLRQFMERAQVPELFQVTRDDSGQQGMLLPVAQPAVKKANRID
jgi:hypothetical protein